MVRLRQVSFLIQGLLCNISEGQILISSLLAFLSLFVYMCMFDYMDAARPAERAWMKNTVLILTRTTAFRSVGAEEADVAWQSCSSWTDCGCFVCFSFHVSPPSPPLPVKQCLRDRLLFNRRRGGRPHRGNCLESRTLSNKHSALIVEKDASWGSLLRLHRGREGVARPWLLSSLRGMF